MNQMEISPSYCIAEAKNKDLVVGVERVQRYARGLKRAQPWVHETVIRQEERMVFFPLRVYRHTCLGILFTFSSSDDKRRLALKMSWQDLERGSDDDAVMKKLGNKFHPNATVLLKYGVSPW
ncbi:hypothetical protein JVT61DRAFT_559 [Boletus reticuloceps]|uniref:Uncharacterized protein n=1 Tax=Boletus reticuloceps TaxID=495285 RepID=A0A8I3AGT8_9AGAM|nr:hypothetical protein JVT61DRAFT_559 [Boletus reticuloceps]